MSRREQRGPLLDGTFDVLQLPVSDLEAAGHQRNGPSRMMPAARRARAMTSARIMVIPAAMRSGSFIGFTRSPSNTHAERRARVLGWTLMPRSFTPAKATVASTSQNDLV